MKNNPSRTSRRSFVKLIGTSIFGASFSLTKPNKLFAEQSIDKTPTLIKPKKLSKGSRIGIISPASSITKEELDEIDSFLNSLGFIGVPSKYVLDKLGYLAGTDNNRVEDIHEMFSRKDIDAILCARGGYGTPRILPFIDYKLIRRNPKIILGYSDITSLLIAIYQKARLVTFHGPVGISTFNEFTLKYFNEILVEGKDMIELKSEQEITTEADSNNSINEILKITPGKVEGELVGGNLSLLLTLLGTEYDLNLKGKILFIEEVGEEPYRIDRMLTQLLNSGKLNDCAGIAMGVFSNCEVKKVNPSFKESLNLREVLIDRLSPLNIPTIYGLSFGHIKNKFTLPIGIRAMLDVENAKLILLERAVS